MPPRRARPAPHPPRRLQGGVAGVEDGSREPLPDPPGELVPPLGCEPVLDERVVLAPDLVPLLVVRGQAQAARPARTRRPALEHVRERVLSPAPVRPRGVGAHPIAGDVVSHRTAAQGEAAVAAARPGCDLARLVHAHAAPPAGERERASEAGDAAADDRDVDRALCADARRELVRLEEPVGGHAAILVDTPSGRCRPRRSPRPRARARRAAAASSPASRPVARASSSALAGSSSRSGSSA